MGSFIREYTALPFYKVNSDRMAYCSIIFINNQKIYMKSVFNLNFSNMQIKYYKQFRVEVQRLVTGKNWELF